MFLLEHANTNCYLDSQAIDSGWGDAVEYPPEEQRQQLCDMVVELFTMSMSFLLWHLCCVCQFDYANAYAISFMFFPPFRNDPDDFMLESDEVEDFLSGVMNDNYSTIVDDGSLEQVRYSSRPCLFYLINPTGHC